MYECFNCFFRNDSLEKREKEKHPPTPITFLNCLLMGMRDGIGQLRDTVGQSAPSDQGMEWHWAISEPSKRGNGTGSNNVNGGVAGEEKRSKCHCPSCSEVRKMSIKAEAESLVRGRHREKQGVGVKGGGVFVCVGVVKGGGGGVTSGSSHWGSAL